jgi:demethylspheroidene O-methyltransferase
MRLDPAERGQPFPGEPPMPEKPSSLGWRARWRRWRNGLLASPRFQRWAADFPLTRRIARRRAAESFGLLTGFVYSQILLACVRLDLFAALADGPRSLGILAARCGLAPEAMERLLRAAISIRLVERAGEGLYALGAQGATLQGNPSLAAMIEHHALFYEDLVDPVALLKGEKRDTALKRFWAYAKAEDPAAVAPERAAAYSTLMAKTQGFIARDVLDAYDFARHRAVLDIGGGEGAFLSAVGAAHPSLSLNLFDLPAVAARAAERFAAAGLAARAETYGGDFFADALPHGADLATFVRVLHDHDDDAVSKLLRAAHTALGPGGRLLIAEPLAGTPGAESAGDGYFGLYLAAMGSGRARTFDELSMLLRSNGFSSIRLHATRQPLLVRVITARA